MTKVYVLAPGEDWIVDRFVKEWNEDNPDISVVDPKRAQVIWLLSSWTWNRVPVSYLANAKVLTTIHHEVPEKFGTRERQDFLLRDRFTTAYHVYNELTAAFVKQLTEKPVHLVPYWANDKIWRPTGGKTELREKHKLPPNGFMVGSFQRDTEGRGIPNGIFLPKLEKGPDLLVENLVKLKGVEPRLHVVLAGWRRQYVIDRLRAEGISFSYFELPSQEILNELYQVLDMYVVASRCEGGPQALIEAGLLKVPVISRDVGIARQVLPGKAINDDLWSARPAIPNIDGWRLPGGYDPYRRLLASL